MKLDDVIGDVIFISFREIGRFKEIGINKPSGHFTLKGYDNLGLWLAHPGIIIEHIEDESGRPLPPDQQSQEEIDAVFMVHWDNVNTMMHYPNRKGYDLPDQFRKKIGFNLKNK